MMSMMRLKKKKTEKRKLRIKKNLDIMKKKKNEMKSSQQVHFYHHHHRHQPNVLFFPFHIYIFSPSFFTLLSHDKHIHSQSLAEVYVSVSAERVWKCEWVFERICFDLNLEYKNINFPSSLNFSVFFINKNNIIPTQ